MTTTEGAGRHIADPTPQHCSSVADCPARGTWGATGVLPPGHHIHFTENGRGQYLAHGKASARDADQLAAIVWQEYEQSKTRAAERRDRKLAAIEANR